jgi:hypothetical protein
MDLSLGGWLSTAKFQNGDSVPLIEGRYDNLKIWRPIGTKYSQISFDVPNKEKVTEITGLLMYELMFKFAQEFGRVPDFDGRTVVTELTFSMGKVYGSLFELPED